MDYYRNNIRKKDISYGREMNELDAEVKLMACEERAYYSGLTFRVYLSAEGKGKVVLNTALAKMYTIAVFNQNAEVMTGHLEISPDGKHYVADESDAKSIEPDKLQIFMGAIFMKYTAIRLEGIPHGVATVFFQAQYE